ncbi:hypothetical protein RR42_m1414 [Cupriavidus basilensis]|uniref:Uncharacterized protein n=2 Tax=Cupriavidus basilensis TaxID=68895 RepID=A0A0C4Y702_9BURK|nr:hypothetical protein RR42_m1414 [Cupriavidus basilensis]
MVSHWLGTPPNGYLGSPYGSPIKDMLQTPQAAGLADAFLGKLRTDVPVITALPNNAVNLYYQDTQPDKRSIFVEVAGKLIEAPKG